MTRVYHSGTTASRPMRRSSWRITPTAYIGSALWDTGALKRSRDGSGRARPCVSQIASCKAEAPTDDEGRELGWLTGWGG